MPSATIIRRPAPAVVLRTTGLFVLTAVAEILGCAMFGLALRQPRTPIWLLPAGVSLALFAWLLTLHPAAAGRVYAAYGAVYVSVALLWLRVVDGVPLTGRDLVGAVVVLTGMGILMGGAARR
ncbi:MAG: YnfA family protein [Cyanobacteriota bacterium]|nr:YnfA family protein [Cyanobacteriota bacterium]